MDIEKKMAWMRDYDLNTSGAYRSKRLVMHMDFQCAVKALPDEEQNRVIDTLRLLQAEGWNASVARESYNADLFSIQLTEHQRAIAGRDGERMFLLGMTKRP